jgi:hypothetical protein
VPVGGAPPATTATVAGLVAGDGYSFTVTAANGVGSSVASSPSNAIVAVALVPSGSDSATSTGLPGSATALLGMPGRPSSIVATATGGEGTLVVATYQAAPIGSSSVRGTFYDVRVVPGAPAFAQVVVTFCGVPVAGSIQYWDALTRSFAMVPEQSAPSGSGACATIVMTGSTTPSLADLVGTVFVVPSPRDSGYDLVGSDGGVFAVGDAPYVGSLPALAVRARPVVGVARRPQGGYWLAGTDGGVFALGDARFHGSMAGSHLHGAVVGMASTPDGGGYWLVGSDGGVFAFGDARYLGSLPATAASVGDVVGMASTPDGGGYWLVGSDGGVFAFGDAQFRGSMAGRHVDAPVVAITSTPGGTGYVLAGADGGVFAFGDARYLGSLAAMAVHVGDVVGMASTPDGGGYWLVGADGGVFAFGDAQFRGSMAGRHLNAPVVGGAGA